jgi:hypothetical protein
VDAYGFHFSLGGGGLDPTKAETRETLASCIDAARALGGDVEWVWPTQTELFVIARGVPDPHRFPSDFVRSSGADILETQSLGRLETDIEGEVPREPLDRYGSSILTALPSETGSCVFCGGLGGYHLPHCPLARPQSWRDELL